MTDIDWSAPCPKGYWRDVKGNLVHERNIRPVDRDMDEVVRRIHGFGGPLSEQMWRFRDHTMGDIAKFAGRVAERYGARVGGRKGNLQLTTFDGVPAGDADPCGADCGRPGDRGRARARRAVRRGVGGAEQPEAARAGRPGVRRRSRRHRFGDEPAAPAPRRD